MLPPVLDRLPMSTWCVLLRAGRDVPEPRAESAAAREPRVHHLEDARGESGLRRRVRRGRGPLLLRRRHRRLRSGRLRDCAVRRSILAKEPGGKVIYDVRASWAVPETIERAGGVPLMNRVGHAFIKQRMREDDAVFGGEVSAHYYFRDFSQADSGTVPFLLMLELVSRRGKLSEVLAPFREYFITGEINTPVADVPSKLQELEERFGAGGKVTHLDGLSIESGDWHFNVRPSNTEPLLRLNLEARTQELMERKRDEVLDVDPLLGRFRHGARHRPRAPDAGVDETRQTPLSHVPGVRPTGRAPADVGGAPAHARVPQWRACCSTANSAGPRRSSAHAPGSRASTRSDSKRYASSIGQPLNRAERWFERLVDPVRRLGEAAVELAHPAREAGVADLHHQVIVVRHQALSDDAPTRGRRDARSSSRDEAPPTPVPRKNRWFWRSFPRAEGVVVTARYFNLVVLADGGDGRRSVRPPTAAVLRLDGGWNPFTPLHRVTVPGTGQCCLLTQARIGAGSSSGTWSECKPPFKNAALTPRRVLRHRRAGRRLLRPLHAVLRPRAHRVPPPPRTAAPASGTARASSMRANDVEYLAPARFDDLLEVFVRVARDRHGRASRTTTLPTVIDDERRRRTDGDREGDARLHRPRRAQGGVPVPRRVPTTGSPRSKACSRELCRARGDGRRAVRRRARRAPGGPASGRLAAETGRRRTILKDGHVVFFTQPTSPKARDVTRDPRVALSATDRTSSYRSAWLRGRVARVIEGEPALDDHRPHLRCVHRQAVPGAQRQRVRDRG